MKKNLSKITSLVLSLVLIFSGIFSVIVSADTTEERPKMIKDHFEHLNIFEGDVAPNMNGTCAFVAMSMLLSYYDSYWNDRFIPNDMDWDAGMYNSSNDTLYSTFNANTEASEWDSYSGSAEDFSIEHENEYLQSHLMGISREKYLFLQVALVEVQVKAVLEDYLYNTCDFTKEQVEVKIQHQLTHGDDTLYNTMKEQIALKNPVIYLGLSLDEVDLLPEVLDGDYVSAGGHAMVAYDVTNHDGHEDIKLHTGWNPSTGETPSYDYVVSTEYSHHNSIIWLEIDDSLLSHECTDAYYDVAINDTVCSCEVYCRTHPEGTHSAGGAYLSYNENGHTRACVRCGQQVTESHTHTLPGYIGSTHTTSCACGHYVTGTHTYTYAQYSSTQHKCMCFCGYTRLSAHLIRDTSAAVKRCIYCNAIVQSGGGAIVGLSLGQIQYITDNGSYVRPDGIIVVSDIDYELYLSGELDLDSLVYSSGCTH